MKYTNVKEWLDEVENYGTRGERVSEDIHEFKNSVVPWLEEAWNLGQESVKIDATKELLQAVLMTNELMLASLNGLTNKYEYLQITLKNSLVDPSIGLLLQSVGKYAASKGEDWRIGEGVEIMDAYNSIQEKICG